MAELFALLISIYIAMNIVYVFVLRPRQRARAARDKGDAEATAKPNELRGSSSQTPFGLVTEATNAPTGKRYLVSTAEVEGSGWQTAVFRKRLGPLAGISQPALLVGGAETSRRARFQHDRVEAIVQNTNPTGWEEAKWALVSELLVRDQDGSGGSK